jgi:hypothetical protein
MIVFTGYRINFYFKYELGSEKRIVRFPGVRSPSIIQWNVHLMKTLGMPAKGGVDDRPLGMADESQCYSLQYGGFSIYFRPSA